jgi:hypothetical protein
MGLCGALVCVYVVLVLVLAEHRARNAVLVGRAWHLTTAGPLEEMRKTRNGKHVTEINHASVAVYGLGQRQHEDPCVIIVGRTIKDSLGCSSFAPSKRNQTKPAEHDLGFSSSHACIHALKWLYM